MNKWVRIEDERPPVGVGLIVSDGKEIACVDYELVTPKSDLPAFLVCHAHGYTGYDSEFEDFSECEIKWWMMPELPKDEKEGA